LEGKGKFKDATAPDSPEHQDAQAAIERLLPLGRELATKVWFPPTKEPQSNSKPGP
jgi:hypothetical protein